MQQQNLDVRSLTAEDCRRLMDFVKHGLPGNPEEISEDQAGMMVAGAFDKACERMKHFAPEAQKVRDLFKDGLDGVVRQHLDRQLERSLLMRWYFCPMLFQPKH